MCTSTSSASGRTATVAVEVWMRPRLCNGDALHPVYAAFEFEARISALPFDHEDHFFKAPNSVGLLLKTSTFQRFSSA